MKISSSKSFLSRSVFLAVAALFSVASASAQSQLKANESSSNDMQLVAPDGVNGGSGAMGGGAAAGGGHKLNPFHDLGSKVAIELGAGFNGPIGNDTSTTTYQGATYGPFITWGGNFTVGGGLHLNKRVSVLAEYQFIDDKLPGVLIYELAQGNAAGGNAHIWSLTLDPVIDLFPKKANSIYVTGGGGFYRKVTSLTVPEEVEQCYYYCTVGVENALYGHFSSNQGGANLGFGLTHRFGGVYGDSKQQVYAEARYLFLDTPSISNSNGLGTTGLIPVTVGFRW